MANTTDTTPVPIGTGFITTPESRTELTDGELSSIRIDGLQAFVPEDAANVLVKHLFASNEAAIRGLSYAVSYKLSETHAGGDIVDVYHFDNDSVAFSIADIAGKGTRAAVHAALIKYGLRAYASLGLTPEKVLRSLDRLYLENNAFERSESFATVFFGLVDPTRRLFTYGSAAHEPAILVHADGTVIPMPVTAPLIGVFDDQHHLFKERFVEIRQGTLFFAATDGVTEARDASGDLFGMQRLIDVVLANRERSEKGIVDAVLAAVEQFSPAGVRDDIALIATRFQ